LKVERPIGNLICITPLELTSAILGRHQAFLVSGQTKSGGFIGVEGTT